ncbi:MAG: F0F1 ATP synthase subunit B [Acidimicrobiia bacterium]|nr:F0F1 ATP synthase subunit B [Acidimicrobiia bacterium]
MRIRTAIVAALVLVGATFGFASPASASESIGSCVAEVAAELEGLTAEGLSEEEALHEVEAQAEACVEAPNPVFPAANELIWISISFAIVLFLGLKFALPAATAAMGARTEKIRTDLETAERTRTDAETEAAKYRESLGDAQAESARIIDEARADGERVKAAKIAEGEAQAAEILSRATSEAESRKAQALSDLRSEVVALAVGAAEQVVQRNLDASAQSELIENYINQVGSQN